MLTGREKAKILLEILGHRASKVLSHLQPQYAQILTSSIEDAPEVSQGDLVQIVGEVLDNRSRFQTYNANQIGMSIEQAPQGGYQPQQDVYQGISTLTESPADASSLTASDGGFNYDEEEEVAPVDPRIQKMARVLGKQRPNMIAFFLHYLDDPDKTLIWNELPLRLQRAVSGIEVESVPASKIMFDKLHQMIINDPDFENSAITEPKGLEPGDENLYDGQSDDQADDALQGSVDLLSGALDNGLGYSYSDADEDDDDDEDDEDEAMPLQARSQGSALPESPIEKQSSLSSDSLTSGPVEMNNLSLSDGIETVNFPDLTSLDTSPVSHGSAHEPAPSYSEQSYSEPQKKSSFEPRAFDEEETPATSKSAKPLSSSVSFDEDLLGPDF